MKTVEEIKAWLEKDETWNEDLDGLDKIDVAHLVLTKAERIILPLQAENTLFMSALIRIHDLSYDKENELMDAKRIAREALNK